MCDPVPNPRQQLERDLQALKDEFYAPLYAFMDSVVAQLSAPSEPFQHPFLKPINKDPT